MLMNEDSGPKYKNGSDFLEILLYIHVTASLRVSKMLNKLFMYKYIEKVTIGWHVIKTSCILCVYIFSLISYSVVKTQIFVAYLLNTPEIKMLRMLYVFPVLERTTRIHVLKSRQKYL